jgi:hypothetical protein
MRSAHDEGTNLDTGPTSERTITPGPTAPGRTWHVGRHDLADLAAAGQRNGDAMKQLVAANSWPFGVEP